MGKWEQNKRHAIVPVQGVADVAMAEQAPMGAADPISVKLKQATKTIR